MQSVTISITFDGDCLRSVTDSHSCAGTAPSQPQASPLEDRIQHARGDPASERVLLTRVITADQNQVAAGPGAGQRDLGAVPEGRPGPGRRVTGIAQHRPQRLPGVPAQADDDAKDPAQEPISAASQGAQVSRSVTVGLLAGGAHRTAAPSRCPAVAARPPP